MHCAIFCTIQFEPLITSLRNLRVSSLFIFGEEILNLPSLLESTEFKAQMFTLKIAKHGICVYFGFSC